MVAIQVMQMAVNHIVHMVAMGNSGVAAIYSVDVVRRMFRGGEAWRALVRVGRVDCKDVIVVVARVYVM